MGISMGGLFQIFSSRTEHNPKSYSCIGRLEDKYEDLSYDNLKDYIESSIISIKKEKKNKGFSYEKYLEEFMILQQSIDNDSAHFNALDMGIKELCRYSDIKTYKHNNIQIDTETKYINASPINIISKNYFISTQGPTTNTIEDFWTMVDQYNCNIIIMLCKLYEAGSQKCEKYWDTNFKMEKFTLEIQSEEDKTIDDAIITVRKIKLINNKANKDKIVTQLHYNSWPDRGIPEGSKTFKGFIYMIEEVDKLKGENPGVVHCSAGIGRTGTFIAIYFLYKEIMEQIKDQYTKDIEFSVFNIVRKLKEMRLYMVQNSGQYKYIYDFIECLLKEYNIRKEEEEENL